MQPDDAFAPRYDRRAARCEAIPSVEHSKHKKPNDRAEYSHQPAHDEINNLSLSDPI